MSFRGGVDFVDLVSPFGEFLVIVFMVKDWLMTHLQNLIFHGVSNKRLMNFNPKRLEGELHE